MTEFDSRLVGLGILLLISIIIITFQVLTPTQPIPVAEPTRAPVQLPSLQGNFVSAQGKSITISLNEELATFTTTNETRYYALSLGKDFGNLPAPVDGEEISLDQLPLGAYTPTPEELNITPPETTEQIFNFIPEYRQFPSIEDMELEENEIIKITYKEDGMEKTAVEVMELQ